MSHKQCFGPLHTEPEGSAISGPAVALGSDEAFKQIVSVLKLVCAEVLVLPAAA
jgi:hypothetical protein